MIDEHLEVARLTRELASHLLERATINSRHFNMGVTEVRAVEQLYLQGPMTWHRGAPNTSDRTRYLFQSQYAARWAYVRFNLYNRVPVAEDALRTASDKLLNFLGRPRPNEA